MRKNKINRETRKRILDLYDKECFVCNETRRKLLQVHHIDGCPMNNDLDNLLLVCVVCHALCFHPEKLDEMVRWVEKRFKVEVL